MVVGFGTFTTIVSVNSPGTVEVRLTELLHVLVDVTVAFGTSTITVFVEPKAVVVDV